MGIAAAQTVVITPEQETVVRDYVVAQRVEPVTLPADIVVTEGTVLPETVEVRVLEVPEIEVQYAYLVVDRRIVLVDPVTRRIVRIIDHGNGIKTEYQHMRSASVSTGDQVAPGTQVGEVGTEGYSTGDHLHFTVRTSDGGNYTPIDPEPFMAERGVTLGEGAPDGTAAAAPAAQLGCTCPGSSVGTMVTTPVADTATDPDEDTDTDDESTGDESDTAGPASQPVSQVPASLTLPDSIRSPSGRQQFSEEELQNAAIIISRGKAADLPAEAWVIALITALVESELRNINYGDRDSLGLFQQRPSMDWGTPAQIMDPAFASDSFYLGRGTNPGLVDIDGWQSRPPGDVADMVQRSAFPDKYGERVPEGRFLVQQLADVTLEGVTPCGGTPIGLGSCPQSEFQNIEQQDGIQPVTVGLLRCLAEAFPEIDTWHGVGTRGNATDHDTGHALDAMIPGNYRSARGQAYGWEIAEWVRANATALGVKYIIFDDQNCFFYTVVIHLIDPCAWN
jgi:hypothetical protein